MIRPGEMSDDQFQEQAIGHLLGELDVSAEIVFQEEMARRGSPAQAMLRELRETLGDLALAVEPADPPHALRARVLWSVGAPVTRADSPPASTGSFWAWATAALTAAVAVGLGVWAGRLAEELDDLRESVARLEQRVAANAAAAASAVALREQLELVGGSSVLELRATEALPGAGARLFVGDDGRGLLLADGLPSLPAGRVYALWTTPSGGPAGVFRADPEGRGRLELNDVELAPGAVLSVTEEPAIRVARPTGPVLLRSG